MVLSRDFFHLPPGDFFHPQYRRQPYLGKVWYHQILGISMSIQIPFHVLLESFLMFVEEILVKTGPGICWCFRPPIYRQFGGWFYPYFTNIISWESASSLIVKSVRSHSIPLNHHLFVGKSQLLLTRAPLAAETINQFPIACRFHCQICPLKSSTCRGPRELSLMTQWLSKNLHGKSNLLVVNLSVFWLLVYKNLQGLFFICFWIVQGSL